MAVVLRRIFAGELAESTAEKIVAPRVTPSTLGSPEIAAGMRDFAMRRAMVVFPPGNIWTASVFSS